MVGHFKHGCVVLGLLLVGAMLGGCNQVILNTMVYAPNRGTELDDPATSADWALTCMGVDRELFVPVGPPEAILRVWVIEPRDAAKLVDEQPRGTILVIHGYRNQAFWMRDTAHDLADAGYRVALVDLRGHGGSTGEFISFGAVESWDMVQVIDELEQRGLIAGELGVWGISMGAATAIQLAAHDERVASVVAVAPYTNMREVVPHMVRRFMPPYGWLISDARIQQLIDEAGQTAGFNPDDADTLAAMPQVKVPVLLMHGDWDLIVPQDHSRRLYELAPPGSAFLRMTSTSHIGAFINDDPEREAIKWFDSHLSEPGRAGSASPASASRQSSQAAY